MQKHKRAPTRMTFFLLLMLSTVLSIGIARFLFGSYRVGLRGPLGLFGIPLVLCPFISLVSLFASLCTGLAVWSFARTRSLLPTLVLVLGICLIFQLPLPPDPPTPETLHFWAHRSDYETVIRLARQHQLTPCQRGYAPPAQLIHVSAKDCLSIHEDEDVGLRVAFFPFESYYHFVLYIDKALSSEPCRFLDAYIEQKIEEHWYVCQGDWN